MDTPSKVLITGLNGFTGQHLKPYFVALGFEVVGLNSDLTDRKAVFREVIKISPSYVIHLAAISFAAESNADLIYGVNVTGSINLLDALCELSDPIQKVILASSATVYGNVPNSILSESLCPKPLNHYGCSKLAMEHMAQNYMTKFPLLITRPFNYTGIGHAEHFLIPKIIQAYKNKERFIELGNLEVSREFNDVRDICSIYKTLLINEANMETVNLCSGKAISLMRIIELMNNIAGYEIDVRVNPEFIRPNEIKNLAGDTHKLSEMIQPRFDFNIESTLRWMYESIV